MRTIIPPNFFRFQVFDTFIIDQLESLRNQSSPAASSGISDTEVDLDRWNTKQIIDSSATLHHEALFHLGELRTYRWRFKYL